MNKTRIAVAGAGIIGQAHMGVMLKSATCVLSAIVDLSPAAAGVAEKTGVPLYASIEELLSKSRPDGLILATPNQLRDAPLVHQLEHFGKVVRGEAQPLVTALDGLQNLRITEAIAQAAKTGQVVELIELIELAMH